MPDSIALFWRIPECGLEHLEKLDIEDEGGIGRDLCSSTTFTIGEVVGDVETVLGTFPHKLDTFGPTSDNLIEGELGGFATLNGRIEDRAIGQRAVIVTANGVFCRWLLAVAFVEDLVLKTAREGNDIGFLGIFCQELLPCLASLGGCCCLLALLVVEELVEDLLCLGRIDTERASGNHIGDSRCEIVGIQFGEDAFLRKLSSELLAYAKAE